MWGGLSGQGPRKQASRASKQEAQALGVLCFSWPLEAQVHFLGLLDLQTPLQPCQPFHLQTSLCFISISSLRTDTRKLKSYKRCICRPFPWQDSKLWRQPVRPEVKEARRERALVGFQPPQPLSPSLQVKIAVLSLAIVRRHRSVWGAHAPVPTSHRGAQWAGLSLLRGSLTPWQGGTGHCCQK